VEGVGEVRQAATGLPTGSVDVTAGHFISSASGGRSVLYSRTKSSKRACCWRLLAGGLTVSFLRVRCMRSWRLFRCGRPGLMRSMSTPRRSHQTASFERLKRAFGLASPFCKRLRGVAVADMPRLPAILRLPSPAALEPRNVAHDIARSDEVCRRFMADAECRRHRNHHLEDRT